MSRLEKSVKNMILSFSNTMLGSILNFIVRTIFIWTLGEQYLGLSGLLNNVLGFLSITELGFSTAIGFSLYKPLAEKNDIAVSSLMTLYKKVYRMVAIFVTFSGIILYFFLDFFVSPEQQPPGTTFAYFAFLINMILGYLLSYKTTLISSDNQGYRIVPISAAFSILQAIGQIVVLLIFKDYTIFLAIQIICSVLSMLAQNRFITRKYDNIDFNSKIPLGEEQTVIIKRNMGGLVIAKIGDYLVNSTDNLIITKLVSLTATGLYSNYLTIRNIVNGFIATAFAGITASMGNIVAVESDERKFKIFNSTMFFSFVVYSFEAVCFMCLFNPFIGDIWIGQKYTFNELTVAIIVFNNYLTGLRMPLITMKNAAGKYLEDSWVPFAFAAINLIASIILVRYMGISGVFLGTILGSAFTADWYRPLVIYRTVFHKPVRHYFAKYLLYLALGIGYMLLGYWLCALVSIKSVIVQFIIKCFIAVLLPLVADYLIFRNTPEFAEFMSIIKRLCSGIHKKIRN